MSGMYRTFCNALWQTQSLAKQGDRKEKPFRRGAKAPLLPDDQALEARARHEFFGWSLSHCASHYKTSVEYMRALLAYQSRVMLIARREDAKL